MEAKQTPFGAQPLSEEETAKIVGGTGDAAVPVTDPNPQPEDGGKPKKEESTVTDTLTGGSGS